MYPTILIGLDGATFTILDQLMGDGTMPFLKKFVDEGVRANLLSTVNPLTPPAWISMITGKTPGNHGVLDFIWGEKRETDYYFTLYNFSDIRSETIWSVVSRQNGTSGCLNFPMMSPPPEVSGYVIPGLVSWKHFRRNIFPRQLYDELKQLPGFNPREIAWDFDMEKKAEKGVSKEEYVNWVHYHIRREKQWFNSFAHLMKHHPCDLTAMLFDGTDKISHMGWRYLDPRTDPGRLSDRELEVRNLCLSYFKEMDGFLEAIVELAGPEARIFIASDHGFGPSHMVFRVNRWLSEQGYLVWKDLSKLEGRDLEAAKKVIDNHFILLDWEKTTAYARTVTSNGIHIQVSRGPGQPGVPEAEVEAFRQELIEKLKTVREPETGELVVRRVLTKEEAFPGTHNEHAPDLLLQMVDNGFISILDKTPAVCRRPEVDGTHHPDGILLARGPGIRKGISLPRISIMDVTPALLYSLGLPVPSDLDGRTPTEIFEASFLKQNPLLTGEPTQPPASFATREKRGDPAAGEEKEVMAQLKALGYIE